MIRQPGPLSFQSAQSDKSFQKLLLCHFPKVSEEELELEEFEDLLSSFQGLHLDESLELSELSLSLSPSDYRVLFQGRDLEMERLSVKRSLRCIF